MFQLAAWRRLCWFLGAVLILCLSLVMAAPAPADSVITTETRIADANTLSPIESTAGVVVYRRFPIFQRRSSRVSISLDTSSVRRRAVRGVPWFSRRVLGITFRSARDQGVPRWRVNGNNI